MNFLIEPDLRSPGPNLQPDTAGMPAGPTAGGAAFAENFQALFLNGQGAPLPGGTVSAELPAAPTFFFAGLTPVDDEPAHSAAPAATLLIDDVNPDDSEAIRPEDMTNLAFSGTSPAPAADRAVSGEEMPIDEPGFVQIETPVSTQAGEQPELQDPIESIADTDTDEPSIYTAAPVALPAADQAMASLAELPDQKPAAKEQSAPATSQPAGQAPKSPTPALPIMEAGADQPSADAQPAGVSAPAAPDQARTDANPALPQVGLTAATAQSATPAVFAPAAPPSPVAQALMIAVPAEIPNIVARAIPESSGERITVQLDPPELGRVSIDFRFDGQALQHVTITAETPEAVRQLRLMHGELLEALERNGLGEKDMTFQQQTSQERRDQPYAGQATVPETRPSAPATISAEIPSVHARAGLLPGRLDIRL